MLIKVAYLERRLMDALRPLPSKTDDIVWNYIMYCETMSQYVLQLACKNMVFPDEADRERKEEAKAAVISDKKRLYLHKVQG